MRMQIIFIIILWFTALLFATNDTLVVQQWLLREPIAVYPPAFSQQQGEQFLQTLLQNDYLDVRNWYPQFAGPGEQDNAIRRASTQTDTLWLPHHPNTYQVVYLQGYVRSPSFRKFSVGILTNSALEVFWDGKSRGQLLPGSSWKEKVFSLVAEPGLHRLTIKALVKPNQRAGLKALIAPVDTTVVFMLNPELRMDIHYLLDTPEISAVSLDPTGTYAAVGIRQVDPETGTYGVRYQIFRLKNRTLIRELPAHMEISDLKWSPDGKYFSYIKKENDSGTIYRVNVKTGSVHSLLKKVPHLASHTWGPKGDRIFYTVEEQLKASPLAKHLKTPRDRWPWFRKTVAIFEYSLLEGVRRQITTGVLSTQLEAFSQNGQFLYVTQEGDDYRNRPYITNYLVRINLQTLRADTLLKSGWLTSIVPGPDSNTLLLLGGPSLFGKLGWNLPEGMIPNEFDTQAYLFDVNTQKAVCISREFNPDIHQATWAADGKTIYFRATDGEYIKMYRYNVRKKTFQEIPTAVDVVREMQFDRNGKIGVYWGSSVTTPSRAFILQGNRSRLLVAPSESAFKQVRFGKVEKWDFKNKDGVTIEGRVYYPPDFDPQKTYPAIVYYYGGVNTTVRDFGGRYPKNLFAAHGYVVYVLQPSGATGYGQAFSAWHVNDWGARVSEEIIEGVRQFLEAHPFVDRHRVGAIGASYGGFMTMLLMTKTDLFATGIAHAGISSISSYWGEGFWGYIYSAYSAAGSFPWNRPDIFVDHSPLFHADRVKNPVLLLHGTADTNVPKGESEQFWVALKLLGKPVEYVAIPGQNHHILDYKKRIQWQKTILAWFDRWLKGQPQWWEALYPPLLSGQKNSR